MKKIFIFCFFSILISITSLCYLNFIFLADSSVYSSVAEINTQIEGKVAVIPSGYSSHDVSKDNNKVIFLNKNLVYLIDLNKNESCILKDLSFVEDVSFLDSDNILYVTKNTNSITIKQYSISNQTTEVLGDLSFRYFTKLSNVRQNDGSIFFDIEYLKNNVKGCKSYVFKNNTISSLKNSVNVVKSLNIEDNFIYTTDSNLTYINNSVFQYDDCSDFEILGNDSLGIVYLMDKTSKDRILSIGISSDNINILETYNLSGLPYKEIVCTDSIYLLSDTFVCNLKENIIIPFDNHNVFLVKNNTIYYEKDGEILYKTIIGG